MRISTRLAIAAVVPALMAVAMAGGLLVSHRYVSELQEQQAVASRVSSDLNEMNDLARSYVFQHQNRIFTQFMFEYDHLMRTLENAEPTGIEQVELVKNIERDAELMRSLFQRVELNNRIAEDDDLAAEAEERLAAQLFIRSRDANAAAERWSMGLSDQIVTAQQRIYAIDLALITVTAAVLTAGLIGLQRTIRHSLQELKAGTERIGSGDLEYRINPVQRDELGDLGRSFDLMTEHLQTVTVSRDELEREVEERKRAQEAESQAARASATLAETSVLLAGSPLLDDSLQLVLDLSREQLSAVGVLLAERTKGGWQTRGASGFNGEETAVFVSDENAPARTKAAETREPYLIADVDEHPGVDGQLARDLGYGSYVAYPLVLRDETVATLSVYWGECKDSLTAVESDFLDRVAYILSLSVENERLFVSEQSRRRRIEALHQITEVAVSALDPRQVGQSVVDYLVANGFEYVSVWMARGDVLECLATGNYPALYAERLSPMPILGSHEVAKVYRTDKSVVVAESEPGDADTSDLHRWLGLELGAYALLPVRSRGRTVGVLQFAWRQPREILDEDVRFYSSLGNELGVVLENARLYETEHDIAERLQSALLSLPVRLDGVAFAHAYHSASDSARVGGDFYDLFEIDDTHVGITIGDVAGKGLNAAVLTSLVKNTIRAHAIEKANTPGKILALANDVVYRATAPESFVTVFFAVLDRTDGVLRYANGGHTTTMISNVEGGTRTLGVTGPMLGAFASLEFGEAELCCLDEEHLLFLYTDGLIEARRGDEQYGEGRLVSLLGELGAASPTEVIEAVIEDVLTYTSLQLKDDLAMLAVRRTAFTAHMPHQERLDI